MPSHLLNASKRVYRRRCLRARTPFDYARSCFMFKEEFYTTATQYEILYSMGAAAAAATVVKRVRRPEHAQDLCVPLQQSQLCVCVAVFSVCLRRTKRTNDKAKKH